MSAPAQVERTFEAERDGFQISTDVSRLDRVLIHEFLNERSYWAKGIPFEVVSRSIDHSLNFGLYDATQQLGYGRAITDRATFAFIRDVFVLESHRGRGLGEWLVATMLQHPDLQGLRRVMLVTRDAQSLYQRLGFRPLSRPDRFLAVETRSKEIYAR